jgi:hypothetical protein
MASRLDISRKVRQFLITSSHVDLEGEHIDDLSRIGRHPTMRSLCVSYCQLSSLSGLLPLPNLTTFIADNSQLSSFVNFLAIGNVRKLSLLRTPLLNSPTFTLSALLVCPRLLSLNGKQVPPLQRQRATQYPPLGRDLVNAGWFAEFPPPSSDRITELTVQYRVALPQAEEEEEIAPEIPDVDIFDDIMRGLWTKHEALVADALARCEGGSAHAEEEAAAPSESSGTTQPSYSEAEQGEQPLLTRLAGVLRDNGVDLDDSHLYASVVGAVDGLCAHARTRRARDGDQPE